MGASHVEEVEEARARPELLFQDEHALVLEHPSDLAVGIEEVPEDAGSRGTRLETRGEQAFARAMQTERALLDDALRANAVREVALRRVDVLRGDLGLLPIEATRVIRTRGLAVAAADAPVVVDDDDPVLLLPRRLHRADLHAR